VVKMTKTKKKRKINSKKMIKCLKMAWVWEMAKAVKKMFLIRSSMKSR
jgi:hypothetical protein